MLSHKDKMTRMRNDPLLFNWKLLPTFASLPHFCNTVATLAERFTSSVGSFLSAGGGESFNELTTVCFFKKPAMPKQKDELKINCSTLSEVC